MSGELTVEQIQARMGRVNLSPVLVGRPAPVRPDPIEGWRIHVVCNWTLNAGAAVPLARKLVESLGR